MHEVVYLNLLAFVPALHIGMMYVAYAHACMTLHLHGYNAGIYELDSRVTIVRYTIDSILLLYSDTAFSHPYHNAIPC